MIDWKKDEEENFEKWLVLEKKSWGLIRQIPYVEIPMGIQKEDTISVWQHDLYENLYEEEKRWAYFYTHAWRKRTGHYYFVDFEENGHEFRLDLTIIEHVFSSEIFIKQKEEELYYCMSDRIPYDEEMQEIKNVLESVLSVYRRAKEFILNTASHRLLVLTGTMEQHERSVEKLKDYYASL